MTPPPTTAEPDDPRPLAGVTVLALEQAIAAPLATRLLADQGARVIKIERPGEGDFARHYDRRARGLSSHFVWVNRGKQSLTLDLKHPDGQGLLHRLLAQADVLVQNLAPGAAARLGLEHAVLQPLYPRLIVCDISGYGDGGPLAGRKAYDLLVQAEAGLLSVTGTPEAPARAGIPVADIAAGMFASHAVLAALLRRARSGRGGRIAVTLLEALAEWMGFPLYYALDGQPPPPRAGAAHPAIAPYGPFAARDGTVLLAVQNAREWRAFCEQVLQRPALADDPRFADGSARVAQRAALQAEIDAVFADLTVAQLQARLDAAGIAQARVNDVAGLWAHPQLAARRRWTTVDTPVGPLPAWRPPGLADDQPTPAGAVPALGEHTETILREIGCDAACIAALRAAGVV